MSPLGSNVFLAAFRVLLKPRFLVLIGTVSVLCILGFHHRDLDTTYRQLPKHFERIGNKILKGEDFLPSDRKAGFTTDRLDYAELIYQVGLPRRKEMLDKMGESVHEKALEGWWQSFPASFSCPHDVQRVGPYGHGGVKRRAESTKWICGLSLLKEPCVVYSFGISPGALFEKEIAAQTGCEVFVFDDSVDNLRDDIDLKENPRVHLQKVLLGHADSHDDHGSWKTLQIMMRELGHNWIDVLTVDIAGGGHQWSEALLTSYVSPSKSLPFGQLQVRTALLEAEEGSKDEQEHGGDEHEHETEMQIQQDLQLLQKQPLFEFRTWFEALENAGLRPFRSEVDLSGVESRSWKSSCAVEYSFINIYGDHSLLRD